MKLGLFDNIYFSKSSFSSLVYFIGFLVHSTNVLEVI